MAVEKSAAVFLDRDGTLVRDVGYLRRPEELEILPRAAEALARLRQGGLKIVVVTNQSGIARGLLSEQRLAAIHALLVERLAAGGATVDGIYYCPHHPTEGVGAYRRACDCRKPNTGLVRRATEELAIEPRASYVVGDQSVDMELAGRVGAKGVWIDGRTGPRVGPAPRCSYVATDLWDAAQWVIEDLESRVSGSRP
ncbi:MAG TPA: HAD family hydrolase [Candidatus Eisenbacteria bacterium]|nr:HAD family hydrolase [Candidatus Eisenbacteria bacterium]